MITDGRSDRVLIRLGHHQPPQIQSGPRTLRYLAASRQDHHHYHARINTGPRLCNPTARSNCRPALDLVPTRIPSGPAVCTPRCHSGQANCDCPDLHRATTASRPCNNHAYFKLRLNGSSAGWQQGRSLETVMPGLTPGQDLVIPQPGFHLGLACTSAPGRAFAGHLSNQILSIPLTHTKKKGAKRRNARKVWRYRRRTRPT